MDGKFKTDNLKIIKMEDYSQKEIEEFVKYHREICELNKRLNDLSVGDVFVDKNNRLVPKGLEVIKRYEGVPVEFREKFDFNVKEIEKKISNLQKEYFKD